MAFSPVYDKGTRFTNYSSIHSADAFVGDYQVMYTPGSTSPPANRGVRKSSRFSKPPAHNSRPQNVSQSYLLPSNMPNTSQILPDQGVLPNIQVHYNIPADEKQIVASLRTLQRDLAEAMQTIDGLTRERDEAIHELRLLRATSRKPSSPAKKQNMAARVEEELFDLSRMDSESPPRPTHKQPTSKKVAIDQKQTTVSDNARVLSAVPVQPELVKQDKRISSKTAKGSLREQKPVVVEDTEDQSIAQEDPTAASNTSRRRRHATLDENMTSAYIIPDITEQQQQQQLPSQMPRVSKEAQQVLHSLEPEHVASCDVCRRLVTKTKSSHKPSKQAIVPAAGQMAQEVSKPDYTRKLAGFLDESFVDDPTMRPKILPAHALARVRALMNAQFLRAKERHNEAWIKYDAVDAPLSSRRHAQIGKELSHWAEKMEECRVHLDYLRDVEEGMSDDV